jgi:hypothetical protein
MPACVLRCLLPASGPCKIYVYQCVIAVIAIAKNTVFTMFNYGSNSGVAEDAILTGFYVVYTFIFGGQTVFTEDLKCSTK